MYEEGGLVISAYIRRYLEESVKIIRALDLSRIERMVKTLIQIRKNGGRIFFIGVGGSAANASHAVNDFRKIAGFECYAPTDNVSELTSRINDDGWDTVFAHWLKGSRLSKNDAVFVFSVGGGNAEKKVSQNIVRALELAKNTGSKILGIVGRDGGYTARVADACLIVPTVNPGTVTAHTEAFQAVLWHLIVSHPEIKKNEMKWESTL
jgi:D-sedoheptulose 7-phosphate isomerase